MAELATWSDSAARRAIVSFVDEVTKAGGPRFVPPADRLAVFDNDGTLWCEKPVPVELGFILERLAEMAARDPALQDREPWKAAYQKNYAWLGGAITKHYKGDDSDVKRIIAGILQAFAGMSVDEYGRRAAAFLATARHPRFGARLTECVYAPMLELLRFLESRGFTTYIASGGDRDFMRVVTGAIYQIPSDRVIGSSNALRYVADTLSGSIVYLAQPDVFDDGPVKPVRIWSRIGRRPLIAVGNSNGDIEMLQFAGGPDRPALRVLLLHDDADREFEYTGGAERSLQMARERGWTIVSMRNDWSAMFLPATA